MVGKFRLGSTVTAALMTGVLVLLGGPGAQAAGDCGSEAFAHRGAHSATVDENTLESIERAAQLGAWTENDVFLTKDGQFVIIHNQGIGFTTNCVGDVKTWLMADIKQQCHTTPNIQQVPTANEAFATLAGNPGQVMNLEVKGPGWWANNNAKLGQLYDAANNAGVAGRVYFSNDATYRLLTAMRAAAPNSKTAWKPDTTEPDFSTTHAHDLGVDAVMAVARQWTSQKVTEFKNAGYQTWAKATDIQSTWLRNWKAGIKAQLTNVPDQYKTWCNSVA
jgi:glycerophosphoryl diester phosphodiesterase